MNTTYQTIRNYVNSLQELTNWKICLFDPYHLWKTLEDFSLIFENELIHNTDYCLRIKSNGHLWRRCISCKYSALEKLKKTRQPFYGECYFGVGEYLYPIILDDKVVAYISVYGFKPRQMPQHQQELISKRLELSPEDYYILIDETLSSTPMVYHQMDAMLAVLAQLLLSLLTANTEALPSRLRQAASHTYPLPALHAMDYIRELYMQPIQVADIAKFCHVSESYLQHVFKEVYGYGPYELLIRKRLEYVQRLLVETNLPVYAIAARSGFSDANYLSAVFSKRYGITCLKYRRKYTQLNQQPKPSSSPID